MKTYDSLVTFKFEKLQEILQITSIDANIRKIKPQYLNKSISIEHLLEFTFTFIFNNESPAEAKVKFLTSDEYLESYNDYFKVFSLNGISYPAKQILMFQVKNQPIYKENFKIIDAFSSHILGDMIFDELYDYFKKTNKFKILNVFYKT